MRFRFETGFFLKGDFKVLEAEVDILCSGIVYFDIESLEIISAIPVFKLPWFFDNSGSVTFSKTVVVTFSKRRVDC